MAKTIKSFNPVKIALDVGGQITKSVATSTANSILKEKTGGRITSLKGVTPSNILNQTINSASKKLPKISNPILNDAIKKATAQPINDIRKVLDDAISNNPISEAIAKGSKTLKDVTTIDFGGSINNVAESIFKGTGLSYSTKRCGYSGDVGSVIPENQLIRISATSEQEVGLIVAKLQKSVLVSVNSEWEPFMEPDSTFNQVNKFVQTLSGAAGKQISLINPITSRRIWKGTSPISMSIELKFVAVTEGKTFNEVVEPCLRLQRLALPTYGQGKIPLMNPPGPYATNFEQDGVGKGDIITIEIANIIKLSPVIIKEVSVEWDNKLDADGRPVSATCNVEFESYQIMSKKSFSEAMGVTYNTPSALTAEQKSLSEQQATAEDLSATGSGSEE